QTIDVSIWLISRFKIIFGRSAMAQKPLKPEVIRDRIDNFLLKKGGSKITPQLIKLRRLFENDPLVPIEVVAQALFDKPDKRAFQKWTSRINRLFSENEARLIIYTESEKQGVSAPKVWFEGPVDALEEIETKERKNGTRETPLYAPERFSETIELTYEFKALRFPEEIEVFLKNYGFWKDIHEEARRFLCGISIKLEPFYPIDEVRSGQEKGFELLGIGPAGESYYTSFQWLKGQEVPGDVIKLSFLLAGLLTANHIHEKWAIKWKTAKDLRLTVNIDSEMITSPYFNKFAKDYERCFAKKKNEAGKPNLLFEINEDFRPEHLPLLEDLVTTYNIFFVLDDSDTMDRKVRQNLYDNRRLVMTKHDSKATRNLLKDYPRGCDGAIAELERFQNRGKDYVIEGIERNGEGVFLRNNWVNEKENTYTQGWAIKAGGPWLERLRPLRDDPDSPCAYVLLPEAFKTGRTQAGKGARDVPGSEWKNIKGEALWGHERFAEVLEDERSHLYQADFYEETSLQRKTGDSLVSEPALPFLLRWAEDTARPFCVLLGDYGTGKTFLARMLARGLLDKRRTKPETPVPLYCDMRNLPGWDLGNLPKDTETLISQILESKGMDTIPSLEVITLVRQGKIVLIMDGFDEKACYLVPEDIRRLWTLIWGVLERPRTDDEKDLSCTEENRAGIGPDKPRWRGKVFVTCRQHLFLDKKDEGLHISGEALLRTGFLQDDLTMTYLKGFEDREIKSYVTKRLGDQKGAVLLKAIEKVHDLKDLARRPVLLVYIIGEHEQILKIAERGEHISDAVLYESMVNTWLNRDAGKHKILVEAKVGLMEGLAFLLWQSGRTSVHYRKLYQWARPAIVESHPVIKEWLGQQKDPASVLNWMLGLETDYRTATFITRDGDGRFSFAHRSYHEYFLARAVLHRLARGELSVLDIPPISGPTVDFVAGLSATAAFEDEQPGIPIANILEQPYRPKRTENALILYAASCRRKTGGFVPRPRAIQAQGAHLPGFDLSGIELHEGHFNKAYAVGTIFSGAAISQTDFSQANLTGACFDNAIIGESVLFPGASADGTSFRQASLHRSDFTGSSLRGAQFLGARMREIGLDRADLSHAGLVAVDAVNVTGKGMKATLCRLSPSKEGDSLAFLRDFGAILPPQPDPGNISTHLPLRQIAFDNRMKTAVSCLANTAYIIDLVTG
ncbi:MAG: hypothetical protein C0407_09045, partial [Desulfobacca sp.]|nr:hypothetical protein [Desulfobacca sp.]